jgi:serpin B
MKTTTRALVGLVSGFLIIVLIGAVGLACGTAIDSRAPVSTGSDPTVLAGKSQAEPSTQAKSDARVVAGSSNLFGFELFGTIRSKTENLVVSPYGLSVVLSMAMAGANGETRQQMADVLHLTLPEGQLYPALGALASLLADVPDLALASALWGQSGLSYQSGFIDLLGTTYGTPLRLVDFGAYAQAAKTINDWVSKNTNGRIPELVSPNEVIPAPIVLMLTSAVYMKAKWQSPFSPEETRNRTFHLLDGSSAEVPTMSHTGNLKYLSDSDLDAVELPYEDGRLSLLVLAPKSGEFEGSVGTMNADAIDNLLYEMGEGQVELRLPRFTFTSAPEVTRALKVMGMRLPFASEADFSGITEPGGWLSGVVQKAFILVDEEGTEAAAASGGTVAAEATTTSLDVHVLNIDRPFYYLVRDNETGAILFLGQVIDPR